MPSFDEVNDCCADEFAFEWPDVSSAMKAIEDGGDDDDALLVTRALSRPPFATSTMGSNKMLVLGSARLPRRNSSMVLFVRN